MRKLKNSQVISDTKSIQKIHRVKWVGFKGNYHVSETGAGLLELVESEEEVLPGLTFYIRPNNYSNNYYETQFSPLVHIDSIREFIREKRIWRKVHTQEGKDTRSSVTV